MNLRKPVAAALAVALVLAGVALAQLARSYNTSNTETLFSGRGPLESRVRQLESALDETLKIQSQLFDLVHELSTRITPRSSPGEIRTAASDAEQYEEVQSPYLRHQADQRESRFQRVRERQIRQLTDAGLTPERARYIVDKQESIQYEQMQLTYQFRFLDNKTSKEAEALKSKIHTYSNPRRVFEQELSPQEFDQYLSAMGGTTELQIGDLLEAAPAYEAGLRPGDKIIRYNNQRVFHMGDLRTQVYQVEPGKNVAVEIQRQGSSGSEVIYLPSGPLGIRG